MELNLQQFINSVEQLAALKNIGVNNPVQFVIAQPVTASQFLIIASIEEPQYLGIPLETLWVCFNPLSVYFKRCLKLKASVPPVPGTMYDGLLVETSLVNSWTTVQDFDSVFRNPHILLDYGGLMGVPGPQGQQGPQGFPGTSSVVDYTAIINSVINQLAHPVIPSLVIQGNNSIQVGSTAQYQVVVLNGLVVKTLTAVAAPISSSSASASVDALNSVTGNTASNVVLTATCMYMGSLLTATKSITVV